MGVQVGGRCYASASDAAGAYFLGTNSLYVDKDYYVTVSELNGDYIKTWRDNNNVVKNTLVLRKPNFPGCDESAPFVQGVELGFACLSVLAVVWGVSFLRRIFYGV